MYLQKRVSGVSTEGCQPLLIIITQPVSLWTWGSVALCVGCTVEPWGCSHPNNALCSSLQDHFYLSLCHHWAFLFLHLLLPYTFLSHFSAFLFSSSIPVLPHPLSFKPDWNLSPFSVLWGTHRKIRVNAAFLQHENIPAFWFHVHFPPIPDALLPTSTALLEGCEPGTVYIKGKSTQMQAGNQENVTCTHNADLTIFNMLWVLERLFELLVGCLVFCWWFLNKGKNSVFPIDT